MKTVLLILLGFLLHKVAYEVISYKNASDFAECLPEATEYRQCAPLLEHSKLQSIILYQPELWCSKISLLCEMNK